MDKLTGPYHDFWVFAESERIPNDFWPLLGRKDAPLRIEDDLLYEFGQTLENLPTEVTSGDPRRKKQVLGIHPHRGLNWFGETIVRGESAHVLSEAARHWCETHAEGAEQVILNTIPTHHEDSDEVTTQLTLPRSVLLTRINGLAELAQQGSQPGFYLLHLGI